MSGKYKNQVGSIIIGHAELMDLIKFLDWTSSVARQIKALENAIKNEI